MSDAERFRYALSLGQFMINRCARCAAASSPDVVACHRCGSLELAWEPASGEASVVSWAVVPARGEPATGPTVVVIAELAEGPWWWGSIKGADPASLRVGATVSITAAETESGALIPVFQVQPQTV